MAPKKSGSDEPSPPTLEQRQERIIDRELQWSIECSLRNHIQLVERAIYQTQAEISQAESVYNLVRSAHLKYTRLELLEEHLKNANVELERIRKLGISLI